MTLIDGERFVTAQLYDDEHEEFTEKKMSIIDCVNAYTDEGVTVADNVLDKIREEIENIELLAEYTRGDIKRMALAVIDKYKAEGSQEA